LRETSARPNRIWTASVFDRRHRAVSFGTHKSKLTIFNKLATIPVVCLKGSFNTTLIVKQNWIAASQNTSAQPGLASSGASQIIPLPNQIDTARRVHSANHGRAHASCVGVRQKACSCTPSHNMGSRSEQDTDRIVNQRRLTAVAQDESDSKTANNDNRVVKGCNDQRELIGGRV
jgi:hypothetical protein